ncbi:WD40-repeat-containing domain protein [Scenedesmus sp. NREL 46B-D3]|nr:WD40-repeat-containing domain protein [Scenedesmus sp. NREL 46B-D3]
MPDLPPQPLPGDEFALPTREVVRPPNQLQLTEAELAEETAKMLTANNPAAPQNVARFNMKERCYKFDPMVEQVVVHYGNDGWLLHKAGEEARRQAEAEKAEAEAAAKFQAELDRALRDKEAGADVEPPDDSRQLRNQFNFSDRAAQTFTYPLRDRATYTEPPPTATVSGSCSMWEVFDEYCRDFERQRQEEAAKQKAAGKKQPAAAAAPQASAEERWACNAGMLDGLRILDRMVNQNTFSDITMDFKYWDDSSDAFKPGEGSLLPLWQFKCEKGKKHVTSICWSSLYSDQFAVGYGSFHYQKQGTGAFSVFSLKNPSHAERTITTQSGVMALHFHPEFSNLLAVGCYDGSVMVFDVRRASDKPICQASVKTKKHADPVWQVCWQPDELQKTLAFVSISTDGDVLLWTLTKCELVPERLMRLQSASKDKAAGAGAAANGSAHHCGCCCCWCAQAAGQENTYLVGTEEGSIHKCSKAYGSDYLATYSGHGMPVYAVKWNAMHPGLFLSCSADWSVKVWDVSQPQAPLMSFDLGAAIGDIAWAPYSSTVFAAVTDDGRVHVFDLAQNRQLPLCAQKCTKKARLTRVVFNPKHPILLIGDSKGNVSALKLSPNLRRCSKPDKPGTKVEELERQKLDRVLEVARKSQAPALAAAAAEAAAEAAALAALAVMSTSEWFGR